MSVYGLFVLVNFFAAVLSNEPQSGKLLTYNFGSKSTKSINLGGPVSSVIPSKNDDKILFLGVNNSIVAVDWDADNGDDGEKVIVKLTDSFENNSLDNGKADKYGRLWIGTKNMGQNGNASTRVTRENHLYKITKNNLNKPSAVLSSTDFTSGIVWNAANDKMYFVDPNAKKILEFDYNDDAGAMSVNRTVLDIEHNSELSGYPDGMAIDAEDNLWVALNGGGAVIRVNPRDGRILQVIALPTDNVTSVTWGGPNMNVLFVTTSGKIPADASRQKRQPAAGGVFAVTGTGTRGLPEHLGDIFDGPIPKVTLEHERHHVVFDFNQYLNNRQYDQRHLEIEPNSIIGQEPAAQLKHSTVPPSTLTTTSGGGIFGVLQNNFLQKRSQEIVLQNPLLSTIVQVAQNFRKYLFGGSK